MLETSDDEKTLDLGFWEVERTTKSERSMKPFPGVHVSSDGILEDSRELLDRPKCHMPDPSATHVLSSNLFGFGGGVWGLASYSS